MRFYCFISMRNHRTKYYLGIYGIHTWLGLRYDHSINFCIEVYGLWCVGLYILCCDYIIPWDAWCIYMIRYLDDTVDQRACVQVHAKPLVYSVLGKTH